MSIKCIILPSLLKSKLRSQVAIKCFDSYIAKMTVTTEVAKLYNYKGFVSMIIVT